MTGCWLLRDSILPLPLWVFDMDGRTVPQLALTRSLGRDLKHHETACVVESMAGSQGSQGFRASRDRVLHFSTDGVSAVRKEWRDESPPPWC